MSKKTTKIISFRVPEELAKHVDEMAEREEKPRADLVKDIFIPAFERLTEQAKPEPEAVCG